MCTFTQTETQKHTAHTNIYIKDIHTHYTTHFTGVCDWMCCVCALVCASNKQLQHTNIQPALRHTNNAENMPMTLAALLDLGSSRKRIKFDRNVSARMCCVRACMRVYLSRSHGRCTLDRHSPHACIEQTQIDTETEADTGAATVSYSSRIHSLSRTRSLLLSLSYVENSTGNE
jgi:hypothetical protein